MQTGFNTTYLYANQSPSTKSHKYIKPSNIYTLKQRIHHIKANFILPPSPFPNPQAPTPLTPPKKKRKRENKKKRPFFLDSPSENVTAKQHKKNLPLMKVQFGATEARRCSKAGSKQADKQASRQASRQAASSLHWRLREAEQ